MSIPTSQGIPSKITAGDAVTFSVENSDYPASDWTSILYFKDETGAIKNFNRTSTDGAAHVFALTGANTLTIAAGRNLVSVGYTDGSMNRQVSDWAECLVLSDPTTAATPSFAEAQVTLLKTLIASVHASGTTSVNFNGQSFTRANLNELENILTQWQATVYNEQEQAKLDRGLNPVGRRIPTSFVCQ